MTEDQELFETYFKRSKSYYLDRWIKFKDGQKITFNVFAFLFGLLWFIYRKMYIEALVLSTVILGEGILEILILPEDAGSTTNIMATILIATGAGLLGNYFYFRKAEKVVQNAKAKFSEFEQQKIFLSNKGGVSYVFLIAIGAIILLFFIYNNYLPTQG